MGRKDEVLQELLYRNPLRHDGHAYEVALIEYALGYLDERPAPDDFGQVPLDKEELKRLLSSYN